MVVYHLQGYVHSNRYGELWEKHGFFSDVFSTLDLALAAGKEEIGRLIDSLMEESVVYTAIERELFIAEKLQYSFTVFEFDPVRREQRLQRTDATNITLENSVEFLHQIEWEFDHLGNLVDRTEWSFAGQSILPGDYAETAGTLFKLGDFVTIKESALSKLDTPGEIFVVGVAPGRRFDRQNPLCWENLYAVCHLDDGDAYSGGHDHVHESRLELYRGELPADNFLHVLAEIFRDERNLSQESKDLLYNYEKIHTCDLRRHFKFIDDLKPKDSQ